MTGARARFLSAQRVCLGLRISGRGSMTSHRNTRPAEKEDGAGGAGAGVSHDAQLSGAFLSTLFVPTAGVWHGPSELVRVQLTSQATSSGSASRTWPSSRTRSSRRTPGHRRLSISCDRCRRRIPSSRASAGSSGTPPLALRWPTSPPSRGRSSSRRRPRTCWPCSTFHTVRSARH